MAERHGAGTSPAGSGPAPDAPVTIGGARSFDLVCDGNGRTYRVWAWAPDLPAPEAGWPVVLLTDGEAYFATAASHLAIRSLGDLAPGVLVAVGYPDASITETLTIRNTDLTPPTPAEGRPEFLKPADGLEIGGGDVFRRFLVDQVMPAVAGRHPIDRSRVTLFGHSLGGLFTIRALLHEPEAFSTFVASSPSLWWNERATFADLASAGDGLAGLQDPPRVLLMAGANEVRAELPDGLPADVVARLDGLYEFARIVPNAREMAARLGELLPPGSVALRVIEDEGHIGVIPAALSKALSFALGPRSRFDPPD